MKVVIGTHPIPEKYVKIHERMGTWRASFWAPLLEPTMVDKETREAYD